jgi:putative ABC transport system permease protein
LLILTVDPSWADTVVGDLHEEHGQRAAVSPLRAALWYFGEVFRLAARYSGRAVWRRIQVARRPLRGAESRGDSLMRTLGVEIRYAIRSLLQRPALSATVVLTLSLGIGANAAVFAMFDALVLRPFTFPDVDRIVLVSDMSRDSIDRRASSSPANFLDWKSQTDSLEWLSAFQWWDVNLVGRDEPERVQGFFVSADFFRALGIQPALGRTFIPEEETFGRHRRAVIGHGLWQRRFGGASAIVGQTVTLDGEAYDVVGVAPAGFDFPMGAQVWAPLAFDAKAMAARNNRYLTVIGRLAPERSLEDARAQLAVVAQRLERQYPDANRDRSVRVHTLTDGMLDPGLKPILGLWQAAALFVLVIGCTNVMNLLLAKGAERQRDIAVRLAIGASRSRVVRELLIEAVMLAAAAIPPTAVIAWVSLEALKTSMPEKIARFVPGWTSVQVDLRVLGVMALIAIGAAVLFGMIPALQSTRPQLVDTLKEGGRSATSGPSRQRIRRALVVGEISLALPLLVASGMGALGAQRFLYGPQGYEPDGLLTMQVALPDALYPENQARRNFADRVLERVRAVPGVQTAAIVNIMPAHSNNSSRSIELEGKPAADPASVPTVDFRSGTPDMFATLGIPIHRGRGFTTADTSATQQVVILSRSLAQQYWPDEDPLGRRVRLGTGPWLTVVGVCGDIVHDWFSRRNYPTAYQPYDQAPSGSLALLVRTTGNPTALASAARAAVRDVDPGQAVYDVMTMRDALQERTLGLQYIAAVMAVFGGLALAFAIGGVYSVMAYMVAQRTHEIGVRIALGATRRDVLKLTVAQTARLAAIGIVLGVLLSVLSGRLMEAGLLGTIASDARIVISFAFVLGLAALAAGYLPARRAAAIDPIDALRAE